MMKTPRITLILVSPIKILHSNKQVTQVTAWDSLRANSASVAAAAAPQLNYLSVHYCLTYSSRSWSLGACSWSYGGFHPLSHWLGAFWLHRNNAEIIANGLAARKPPARDRIDPGSSPSYRREWSKLTLHEACRISIQSLLRCGGY